MKHYNDNELDEKIESFLSKKLQKYPELASRQKDSQTVAAPTLSTRLLQSLTAINPLTTN